MKYSASSLRLLIALANGETIADSRLKGDLFNRLKEEKLLVAMTRGSRKSWRVQDATALMSYLNSVYGIRNPEELLRLAESGDTSRAEQVHTIGDSKFKSTRSFKGFMVSCYQPIEVTLNSKPFTLHPQEGTFTFIYDFDGFAIPEDVMVVGIENPENFRWIYNPQNEMFAPRKTKRSLLKNETLLKPPFFKKIFDPASPGIGVAPAQYLNGLRTLSEGHSFSLWVAARPLFRFSLTRPRSTP